MKNISKSLVAFFITLEIFIYQVLCLWGSGFAEANRILLFSGIVTISYFIVAIRTWTRIRDVLVLSLLVAVFFGAWTLRIFGLHECGTAGGNGLFYRDFFSGDVLYCMDSLFHSTIVESIKNYAVPSTLICTVEGMSYHVGADWLMAGIARIVGVSGVAMIGYVYPIIFLPLISSLAIAAIQAIRRCIGADNALSFWDVFFFLFFMLIPGFVASLFVYFVHSETCLMGTLFLLIDIVLLPRIDMKICDGTRLQKNLVLFLLIPFLILSTTYSKISAGFTFLVLIGGILLWHVDWRNLRRSTSVIVAGVSYLILFGGMYLVTGRDQTPVMSSDYVYHFLEFGYRCVCHPVMSACLFLPILGFLIPVSSSSGKRIRFVFFIALIVSYIPYVFLRVHGGSEIYFWVNCHLLTLVYFIAIGLPGRCVRFCNHSWRRPLLLIVPCLFAFYVVLPLDSVVSVVKNACVQPRPNVAVLQSHRYREMEKARLFVREKGPRNVMAYVTKDYWTALSSHERMSKAYIFAVQSYLGVPVLGTIKTDSQAIYARKSGEWSPIGLPASYFLDHYMKSPIPEYTETEAIRYARDHGYRYLLVCGANDSVCVRDTGVSL